MVINVNLRVCPTIGASYSHPLRRSLYFSKMAFTGLPIGGSSSSETTSKWPGGAHDRHSLHNNTKCSSGVGSDFELSPTPGNEAAESFLLNAINMGFFERLNLAWKIVFPSTTTKKRSNARIAKQRLKMIIFSDRCAVSDEANRVIVDNIVRALSDFVEIESQDKVQLSVSTDSDVGTIYSVTVPVRRVKPEYEDVEDQ